MQIYWLGKTVQELLYSPPTLTLEYVLKVGMVLWILAALSYATSHRLRRFRRSRLFSSP